MKLDEIVVYVLTVLGNFEILLQLFFMTQSVQFCTLKIGSFLQMPAKNLQLFSLGILKLFNSLCVGSPRNPAGRPVDFLVTADLAMGFVFGTGILLRLVATLRFS